MKMIRGGEPLGVQANAPELIMVCRLRHSSGLHIPLRQRAQL